MEKIYNLHGIENQSTTVEHKWMFSLSTAVADQEISRGS